MYWRGQGDGRRAKNYGCWAWPTVELARAIRKMGKRQRAPYSVHLQRALGQSTRTAAAASATAAIQERPSGSRYCTAATIIIIIISILLLWI